MIRKERLIQVWNFAGIVFYGAVAVLLVAVAYWQWRDHLHNLTYFQSGKTIEAKVTSIERSGRSGNRMVGLEWMERGETVRYRLETRSKYLKPCGTKVGSVPKCHSIELFDARGTLLGLYIQAERDPRKWWVRFPWSLVLLGLMTVASVTVMTHIWRNRLRFVGWIG